MPVHCITFKWTELSQLQMLHEASLEEVHQKTSRFSKCWLQIGNHWSQESRSCRASPQQLPIPAAECTGGIRKTHTTDLPGQRTPSCYMRCCWWIALLSSALTVTVTKEELSLCYFLPPISWADNSWCMSYSASSRSVQVETKGVEAWKFHEFLIYTQMFMINHTETIAQTAAFGNYTELLWYKQKEAFCIQSWKNLEWRHRTIRGLTAFAR